MAPKKARAHPMPARLQRREDFVRVQGKGRRFRRPHLVLLVDRGGVEPARVGYTVSRKVGNAVVRNRIRRRLREVVRAQAELLAPSFDYVMIATPAAARADFATLASEVGEVLRQAATWIGRAAEAKAPVPDKAERS